jgi:exopolysaccharide biosynthesis polyprenyl glycosylphosphotransferase
MSEETLHAVHHPSQHGARAKSGAMDPVLPEGLDARIPSVSPLARRLSAPLVRFADQISLTAALLFVVFTFSLLHGASLSGFLSLRISLHNLLIEAFLLLAWRLLFWAMGLYQPRLNRTFSTFLLKVPFSAFLCTGVAFIPLHARPESTEIFRSCLTFWFVATTLMLTTRAAVFTYEEGIRPSFRRRRTVLICGTGLRARMLALQLPADRDFRYQLAGFIDSAPQPDCLRLGPFLGKIDDMESLLMRLPVDEVIIALPIKSHFNEIEDIIAVCGRAGIQTQYSLDLFTTAAAKHHAVGAVDGSRVVLEMVHSDHRLLLKTTFDRIFATLGLILVFPIMLAIAVIIKLTSPGPVFFVQQRFGLGKRMFGMIKFRSMSVDAEARQEELEHLNEIDGPIFKIKADPRVTRFGAFLRKSSLDELPQLFNVLRGEMSLVGPRPLPSRDVARFNEAWLMRRFSVKPGITGLWQVSGRSTADFDNLIKLDLRYIDRWSLALDIKIILRTFGAVLKGRGAY